MPTYEYECLSCRTRLERRQSLAEEPVSVCPECGGRVRRLISSGTAVVVRAGRGSAPRAGGRSCSREQEGRTCCGREERCSQPPCGDRP